MTLDLFQVDAFTNQLFGGNPAAIIPLETWLEDELMQNIAIENNLSETAFFVTKGKGFRIRWFTPGGEVDLCGHATLATAHVLWTELNYQGEYLSFSSRSGKLGVSRKGKIYSLNFPTDILTPVVAPEAILKGLNILPDACFLGREDYLVVTSNQEIIEGLQPDFRMLVKLNSRGVIVTAPGKEADFVSRCFFPAYGIDEDPTTGSAHTTLAPYWGKRLGKDEMSAIQLSKRVGHLKVKLKGDRTEISGKAVTFLRGKIEV